MTGNLEGAGDRPRGRHIGSVRSMAPFLFPYRLRLGIAAFVLTVGAGAFLAFGAVLREVVDRGLASSGLALDAVIAVFMVIVLVLALSVAARVYLVTWVGERFIADVRRAVFEKVLRLEPAFFELTRTGEVISRLTTDTSLLQMVVSSTLPIAVRNLLLFAGGTVMLAVTSVKLTALVLIGVPLIVAPVWLLGHRVRRLSRAAQDRVADVGAYVDEVLYGIRTVQAFCHEPLDRQRYGERVESAFEAAVTRSRISAVLTGVVLLLVFGAIGLVLWVGGQDVLSGRISPGDLSAFIFYAVLVAGSVGAFSEVVGDLMRAAGASERLAELLSTEPLISAPSPAAHLPVPARGHVVIDGVGFRYPSRPDVPALTDFSLEVMPGETVALVGPSGAGKSTVFQLLLRFYDPNEGTVRFDGVDVRTVDPAELRAHVGLVPQDPVIFGADASENIRYGRRDVDEADVRAAARAAHAAEFLDRLPEGYSSFLGERGVRLSGGERQRIAIARALLRDPALLLLDEATSSLDAESERLVQDALEHLMADRTTLIIAHRLATVRKADRIVVMDEGRVVAMGTHEELVSEGGLYARLAALQFREPESWASKALVAG